MVAWSRRSLATAHGRCGRGAQHALTRTRYATPARPISSGAGAGVRQVRELLGHRSLARTQLYTRVGVEDLRAVLMRAHPRERSRRDRGGL